MYVLLCGNIKIFQFPQLSFHKCIICGRFFSNVKIPKLKVSQLQQFRCKNSTENGEERTYFLLQYVNTHLLALYSGSKTQSKHF